MALRPTLALLIWALLAAPAAAQITLNLDDLCDSGSSSIVAGPGAYIGDTSVCVDSPFPATTGTTQPTGCATVRGDAWFEYQALLTGPVRVSTCNNAGFDTLLAVWPGTQAVPFCANLSSELACNDDAPGCSGFTSELTFNAVAGEFYRIQVGAFSPGVTGPFALVIDEQGTPTAPPNDDCANPTRILQNAGPIAFDTTTATTSSPPMSCGSGGSDIWFDYIAPNTNVEITLCGSSFDTVLEVYEYSVGCGSHTSIACNDDACGLQSSVIATTTPGNLLIIRVGGFAGAAGTGTIEIAPPAPAPNDECATALPLFAGGPVEVFDLAGASISGGPTPFCVVGTPGDDVWYYHDVVAVPVEIRTCGSAIDTFVQVFDGSCGALNAIACTDGGCSDDAAIGVGAPLGSRIYIRVGTDALLPSGIGQIEILAPPQVNEDCQTAFTASVGVPVSFDLTVAQTSNPPAGGSCAPTGTDLWYGFVAPTGAEFRASLCGSSFDTVLEVYEGAGGVCTSITPLACNDDTCGLQSEVEFLGSTGQTFFLRVSGFNGAVGTGDLLVEQVTLPGVPFCSASPNSLGVPSYITVNGSGSLVNNDVRLSCQGLPRNSFGYFVVSSQTMAPVNPPNSQGTICLGGGVGRYAGNVQNSGTFGQFVLGIDNTALPSAQGFVTASAGQTFYFQAWHRDSVAGQATSNFSEGFAVTWQ